MRKVIKMIGGLILILSMVLILKPCIDAKAITNAEGYTYNTNDETKEATITDYSGGDASLAIPSNIGEYKVTEIAMDTFKNNNTIVSIYIPDSVKTIGKCAFIGATKLETVTIENGCTTILSSAFCGCISLSKVVIPSSVTTLEYIDSGNEIFDGIDESILRVYGAPGSEIEIYMNKFKPGYHFYYLDEYTPSSIEFTTSSITVNVGDTYTFSNGNFQVLPSTAYVATPTSYESGDNNIAYVSSKGVLTAKKVGIVTVGATISDEHLENSVTTITPINVNVVENRKVVESVKLNVDSYVDMYVGDTLQLNASILPSDAIYTGEWTTRNSDIVSISSSGLVTAKAVGVGQVGYETLTEFGDVYESNGAGTMIRVSEKPTNQNTSEDNTTDSQITEEPEIKEGKITLNASKIKLQKGKTIKTLKLKTNELEGDKIISVTSSKKRVLKASLSGRTIVLKGIKKYKKYVKVTVKMSSGAKATCKVKVVSSPIKTKKLILSKKKITLKKGKSKKLKVTRNPISATDKLTFKSSNKKIATVNKKGKIKAKKKGKVTITVTSASGKKAKCTVIVN